MWRVLILLLLAGLSVVGLLWFDRSKVLVWPDQIQDNMSNELSFYNLVAPSLAGEPVTMERFRGKKIVVLNVASKCGYTPQYGLWEQFYRQNSGLVVVLGFPCNDFLGQEPGSAAEIADFCDKNYGVSFPMFDKVHVKGEKKAQVYQWLTDPQRNGWNAEEPSWNFCKYLIDQEGRLTHYFASSTVPSSEEFLLALGL